MNIPNSGAPSPAAQGQPQDTVLNAIRGAFGGRQSQVNQQSTGQPILDKLRQEFPNIFTGAQQGQQTQPGQPMNHPIIDKLRQDFPNIFTGTW